jgi:hypothetical protein
MGLLVAHNNVLIGHDMRVIAAPLSSACGECREVAASKRFDQRRRRYSLGLIPTTRRKLAAKAEEV